MSSQVAGQETLRYNPLNAVTAIVERVRDEAGLSLIHKELRAAPTADADPGDRWAASTNPADWNYWRREAAAYQDPELRRSLQGTGLDMPRGDIVEHDAGITLWLEDVAGTPGTEFDLDDHIAVAAALGRWQARGPLAAPWASRGFLRDYSDSKPAPLHLMDDDEAWQQPLIRDAWPPGLRDGWRRLLANRGALLAVMERLPRTRSHLDLWVSNEIRRPSGEIVLLDWAFTGDGAVGEDLGNHIPDAAFDLFWPAEDIAELDTASFESYLSGLRAMDWDGRARDARLGVVASCVKYTWLLPAMLQNAAASEHRSYHRVTQAEHLYRQRGLVFDHLVRWAEEAVRLIGSA